MVWAGLSPLLLHMPLCLRVRLADCVVTRIAALAQPDKLDDAAWYSSYMAMFCCCLCLLQFYRDYDRALNNYMGTENGIGMDLTLVSGTGRGQRSAAYYGGDPFHAPFATLCNIQNQHQQTHGMHARIRLASSPLTRAAGTDGV